MRKCIRSIVMFNLAIPLVHYATKEYIESQCEKEADRE